METVLPPVAGVAQAVACRFLATPPVHVVYHFSCPDGFAAACVASLAFPRAQFHPVNHDELAKMTFPDDELVLFLDIAPQTLPARFFVIDHHKTAQAQMATVPDEHKVFDMNHSGCALTWMQLFPDRPLPRLLRFVEARDLYRHKDVPDCQAYLNGLHALVGYHAPSWLALMLHPDPQEEARLIAHGRDMEAQHQAQVQALVAQAVTRTKGMWTLETAEVTNPAFISDVGNALVAGTQKMALTYRPAVTSAGERIPGEWWCSLRSDNHGGPDVTPLALAAGGGGHAHAAGFTYRGERMLDWFDK